MKNEYVLRELSRYQIGTFADIIYRNALLYPDTEAFTCGPRRATFSGFNESVNRLIHGLQNSGLERGEVIGILSWNRLEYAEVFGAAMKAGFVLAHFNPRLKSEELTHVINDSEARVIFIDHEFLETVGTIRDRLPQAEMVIVFGNAAEPMTGYAELLENQSMDEPEPGVGEDSPLVIFYTSGTTGTPRGAIYTHKQKMENAGIKRWISVSNLETGIWSCCPCSISVETVISGLSF